MATASLDALEVFRAVAELQSFTKAAARLGQDKSHVSRTVRALEGDLGAALLVRTTRSVRLTREGEALLHRVAPLLRGLEQAITAVPDAAAAQSGEVTVTTTPDLGRARLAPALVGFRAQFPGIRVHVVLAHEVVDLMAQDVDLALRVGRPGGDSIIARKLTELDAGFFASPAYLERRGAPRRIEQLAEHEGLWPQPHRGQRSFAPNRAATPASVTCRDFGFLAELARAGGGIALLPTVLAARDVAAGALCRVLPDVIFGGAPLYLVSRPRPIPPRIEALRGHLLAQLAAR
jgi:DNA-binding transcriptional LysR family regulator